MIYYVDIDGTICNNTNGLYFDAVRPFLDRIAYLNQLFDNGDQIHYWTARGSSSGIDWTELTTRQLAEWGCKYTSMSLGKPSYDIWIDDKAMNCDTYFDSKLK